MNFHCDSRDAVLSLISGLRYGLEILEEEIEEYRDSYSVCVETRRQLDRLEEILEDRDERVSVLPGLHLLPS